MLNNNGFSEEYSTRNFTRVSHKCDCAISYKDNSSISGTIHDISINGFKITHDDTIDNETIVKISTDFKKYNSGILGRISGIFSGKPKSNNEYICKVTHTDKNMAGLVILKTNKSSLKSLVSQVIKCGVDKQIIDKEIKISESYMELTKK